MEVELAEHVRGQGKKVFIIAEAGVNHNGNLALAKKLIVAAKEVGADAVKFQTYKTDEVVTRDVALVDYQKRSKGHLTQFEMLKGLEIGFSEHQELMRLAKKIGILFLSTPGDFSSVDLLSKLGVKAYKIGSDDLTNIPLLDYVARQRKPVLLSTGMSTIPEIGEALAAIRRRSRAPIVLMHTTTQYPCPLVDANIRALRVLSRTFKLPVGYSDHTAGVSASMSAVALGACVIEKHLTLDRSMSGPDHTSSYEPAEFKILVKLIREVETCLGSLKKEPTSTERKDARLIRKSIIAGCDIPKGAVIKKEYLALKRPQTGMLPKYFFSLLGKKAKVNIRKDTPIKKGFIASR